MVVEARGFEPLKIPKNHLTYRKAHLSRLASLLWYLSNKVVRRGFEPLKVARPLHLP